MSKDNFFELNEGFEAPSAQSRAHPPLNRTKKTCIQRIGAMKGKLALPVNFDSPLPDVMLDTFEGNQA
ncbi:hypothetical protein [Pseudomonas atagonensis]|uniref:hypothetical protein n=1 Tax=Pseudomonas atagonensis TaxID=2609964 RepID=UPI001FE5E0BD|nr:hypothetical protein [Pseudomonas atagonensis]